jgi:hypothetical protein
MNEGKTAQGKRRVDDHPEAGAGQRLYEQLGVTGSVRLLSMQRLTSNFLSDAEIALHRNPLPLPAYPLQRVYYTMLTFVIPRKFGEHSIDKPGLVFDGNGPSAIEMKFGKWTGLSTR